MKLPEHNKYHAMTADILCVDCNPACPRCAVDKLIEDIKLMESQLPVGISGHHLLTKLLEDWGVE